MNLIVYFVTLRSQVFRNGINYVKSFCNRIVSTSAADAAALGAAAGGRELRPRALNLIEKLPIVFGGVVVVPKSR